MDVRSRRSRGSGISSRERRDGEEVKEEAQHDRDEDSTAVGRDGLILDASVTNDIVDHFFRFSSDRCKLVGPPEEEKKKKKKTPKTKRRRGYYIRILLHFFKVLMLMLMLIRVDER